LGIITNLSESLFLITSINQNEKQNQEMKKSFSPELEDKIKHSHEIIIKAIAKYNPCVNLVGFSGGGDSITVCFLMDLLDIPFRAMFANTGTGIKETVQYIRETSKRYNWRLIEKNPDYKTYEELVMEVGFPGPDMHKQMYAMLKERCFRQVMRMFDKKRDKLILTGARLVESVRRKKNTKELRRDGHQVWVNPIMYWNEDDKDEFADVMGIPQNEVSKNLGMSGECLCGAYAKPGELERVCKFYPDTGEQIKQLEKKVKAKGFPWGWEDEPPSPKKYADIMESIYPGYKANKAERDFKNKSKKTGQLDFFGLCSQCEIKHYQDVQKKKRDRAKRKAERESKKAS
jgi:3'-phosphoadenosine 5'-phosphosulfate sulfotransferase (PAPS reductase)/FAD synthetase